MGGFVMDGQQHMGIGHQVRLVFSCVWLLLAFNAKSVTPPQHR